MTQAEELSDITARVWSEVGGPDGLVDSVTTDGPRTVLPSHFDVTGLATASVAAATLAAAEFLAARNGTRPLPVTVGSRQACAAFAAEGLFTPVGWDLPDVWDPIAGNYQAQDGGSGCTPTTPTTGLPSSGCLGRRTASPFGRR